MVDPPGPNAIKPFWPGLVAWAAGATPGRAIITPATKATNPALKPIADTPLEDEEGLTAAGHPVAIVLADYSMPEMSGTDLLARVHALHPTAKRGLLREWGDRSALQSMLKAMTLGHIDYYVAKPMQTPDEQFHRVIAEFLDEWTRSSGRRSVAVKIIGEQWAPRSHELRDVLGR
jgi:thioredoxin reductase (NADPH)